MAEVINYRFRMRRALAATWTSTDEVLLEGEYGYEKDTGKVKVGDGVTPWNDLDYFGGSPEAAGVEYDNTASGLDAETVQAAIDELAAGSTAAQIGYLHVYHSGTFTTSSGVGTQKVPLDTVGEDSLGIWDAVNHEAVVPEDGVYVVVFHRTTAGTAVQAEAVVGHNAVGTIVASRAWTESAQFYSGTMNIVKLAQGDKVWAGVFKSAAVGIICAQNEGFRLIGPLRAVDAAPGGGGYVDPSLRSIEPVYDFLVGTPGDPFQTTGSGGSLSIIDAGPAAPGVLRLNSGTGSSVRAITMGNAARWKIGAGVIRLRFRFKVPLISNPTDRYTVNIGFRDVWPSAGGGRVDIRYTDDGLVSGVFELACGDGVGTTFAAGSTVVAAETWYACVLEIAADGSSASLYVNGALEVTVSGNMPTAGMFPGALILHRVGSARNLDLDYFAPPEIEFTTPR